MPVCRCRPLRRLQTAVLNQRTADDVLLATSDDVAPARTDRTGHPLFTFTFAKVTTRGHGNSAAEIAAEITRPGVALLIR